MQTDIINTEFFNSLNNSKFVVMSLKDFFAGGRRYNVNLYQPHRLMFFSIVCFLDGKGKHHIDFTEFSYSGMSLFFMCKGQLHAFEDNADANGYILYFTEDFVNQHLSGNSDRLYYRLFNYAVNSPQLALPDTDTETDTDGLHKDVTALFEIMHREYHRRSDALTEDIIRCQLRTLLLFAERRQETNHAFFQNHKSHDLFIRFQQLLEQMLFSVRNTQDYCQALNVGYRKLNTVCKDFTGMTMRQFIDARLTLEIKRLLANSGYSIKEVCYKTGFDEPTNMTKFFKSNTGMLPKDFRKTFADAP